MPKQTFLNLPDEKRLRIIENAIDEFSNHTYSKASLSNVVSKSGIAKGSMYQYFKDKKDLFTYVLDLAVQEKFAYIKQYGIHPEDDFFSTLEKSILAGIKFNLEHPKIGKIFANAMEPSSEEVLKELNAQWKPMTLDFFEELIKKAKLEGSIRGDIDERLITHFVTTMLGAGLSEYILEKLGLTVEEYLKEPQHAHKISQDIIKGIVKNTMSFLRDGLEKR